MKQFQEVGKLDADTLCSFCGEPLVHNYGDKETVKHKNYLFGMEDFFISSHKNCYLTHEFKKVLKIIQKTESKNE